MVRVDLLLFGYVRVNVAKDDLSSAVDVLLKNGISASFLSDGGFIIPYRRRDRVAVLFSDRIDFSFSAPCGLVPFLEKSRNKYGVFLGLIFSLFLVFLSADTVWDVRIEGSETLDETSIIETLDKCGLSVGKRWSKIDSSEIETNALAASEKLSWININRRGSVAYVRVNERITHEQEEKPSGCANIVAERDCVIEEIRVTSGYALVKKGESVRAGEILISGVIPTELGGGFCYASGTVIGRYNERIEAFYPDSEAYKVYGERELVSYKIFFFGREINIFKNYRQECGDCDIMEEKESLRIIKRLPLTVCKGYVLPYEEGARALSPDENVAKCAESLKEKLSELLLYKEVKRMKTDGKFADGGYHMTCDVTVSSSVGKILEFEVE